MLWAVDIDGRARQMVKTGADAARGLRDRHARRNRSHLTLDHYPIPAFVTLVYNILLRREPDSDGRAHFTSRLRRGDLSRLGLIDVLLGSEEFRTDVGFVYLHSSLHHSRCAFVRSLPKGRRILDLGGTDQSDRQGALVRMGYPYPFDELIILDLPHDERHEIYRHSEVAERVDTPLGPVVYRYGSMSDLAEFGDGSFDLVYSGQSIEHVTPGDADKTIAEVYRILSPGGHFALDTPNGPVCRLHMAKLINPDHEIEYSHQELSAKLVAAGFVITEAKGLNYIGGPAGGTEFSESLTARNSGVYADIEDCYLLAYVATKPLPPAA
jgi:SAM-dependent methyltransferase